MALGYRQTKSQEWVVCGPVREMGLGTVTVRTKDGNVKQERIIRLGKPFSTPQGEMVYGYKAEATPQTSMGLGKDGYDRQCADCRRLRRACTQCSYDNE